MTTNRLRRSPDMRDPERKGRLELLGGTLACVFAALFYWMWGADTSRHGERAFLLLPVVVLAPFGMGALVAGAALRYSWPHAHLYSATPFVLTAAAVVTLWARFI